jgi:hypothetical protein
MMGTNNMLMHCFMWTISRLHIMTLSYAYGRHQVDNYFKMKPGSIGDPDFYLGAKLRMKRLSNGILAWSMSSSKYI